MLSDARRTQLMWLVYIAAFLLFISSLIEPAVSTIKTSSKHFDGPAISEWAGWWFLLLGPFAISSGQFGWCANPLMLLSGLPFGRSHKAAFATLAIPFAVSSGMTLKQFPVADVTFVVRDFELGYYLWLACPVLLLLAALLSPEDEDIARREIDAG
jgi:hypothetical protein